MNMAAVGSSASILLTDYSGRQSRVKFARAVAVAAQAVGVERGSRDRTHRSSDRLMVFC